MIPNTSQKGAQPETAPRRNPVLTLEQAQAEFEQLHRWFGPAASFIFIHYGKKEPVTTFKDLTSKKAHSAKYQGSLLEAIQVGGNIALLFGEISGDIRCIDFDDPEQLGRFLIQNSFSARTVQRTSRRGGQIFFKIRSDAGLPDGKAIPLHLELEHNKGKGKHIGELRLGPNVYSVVYGWLDPETSEQPKDGEGVRYELFGEVTLEHWDQINWPHDFWLPWNEKSVAAAPPPFGSPPETPPPSPDDPDDPDDRADPDDQADQGAAAATLDEHLEKRIRAYLDKCDPAISGQGGHNTTFRVACALRQGFMLGKDDCLRLLEYYNRKCQPPWSPEELEHKVADAFVAPHKKPPGYLLDGTAGPEPHQNSTSSPPQGEAAEASNGARVESQEADQGVGGREREFVPPVYEVHNFIELAEAPIDPSLNLLGNGFLKRGGAMLIVGPTEVGKSSLACQMATEWACGLERAIIKPSGPLRVVIVQNEDDDTDVKKMLKVSEHLSLTPEQIELVRVNSRFITWDGTGKLQRKYPDEGGPWKEVTLGEELCFLLETEIKRGGPFDAVVVNPLHAYTEESTNTKFNKALCYQVMKPFLRANRCGLVFVHHTPKYKEEMRSRTRYEMLYLGAGDATVANWARSSLIIFPTDGSGFFEFWAGKGAGRDASKIGWPGGAVSRIFKWADADLDYTLWTEATQAEASATRTKTEKTIQDLLNLIPLNGLEQGPISTPALEMAAKNAGITQMDYRNWRNRLIELKRIFGWKIPTTLKPLKGYAQTEAPIGRKWTEKR